MTTESSAPSVYNPVKLKSFISEFFSCISVPLKDLSESQRCTSIICHVSNISQNRDVRGNADLGVRAGVCTSTSGAAGCLSGFVLAAPCYSLHVLHCRPDSLEESHQTEKSDKQTTENI